MRFLHVVMLAAIFGCGRVRTVVRGSTSIFRASAPAPRHDDPSLRTDARLTVQWVGHATVLLQLGDRMITTDPLVVSTAGVLAKRIVEPGVSAEAFPAVDLAVISHMHVDHLSYGSLELLEHKIGLLAIPEGGFPYLPNFAFPAREAPHWTTIEHAGIRATPVPVSHVGWRYAFDNWSRAEAGWVLEHDGVSVYFAGDTGYSTEVFAAVRKRWPALDLALLPIAPMEPHHLIKTWHMNPAEAVRAFRDLGARTLVPIHFDTFVNSLDEPGDAPLVLERELQRQNVPRDRVQILKIGERRVLLPR